MIASLILAAVWVVLDQAVKFLVRAFIPLYGNVTFLPGFELTYLRNTGAAFSILSTHTWALTLLSGAASVALVILLVRGVLPTSMGRISLALLLGGAVGNFIDRVAFGYVTDMFQATFIRFPVFNVADVGVVVGGILLVLTVILAKEETPA